MGKILLVLGLLLSVFLIGCTGFTSAPAAEIQSRGSNNEISVDQARSDFGAPGAAAAPEMEEFLSSPAKAFGDGADMERGAFAEATPSPSAAVAPGTSGGNTILQLAQRRVISTASISLEVENVQLVADQLTAEAENLGGFIQQLSSSGGPENQRANLTMRVPQAQFRTALDRIKALGEVREENQGSEDVSSQFIDLEARLRSAQREEQSLLSLLERSLKVNEILTVERELNRVRSEIERLQGQLNFLERRVEMATINVFLFTPSVAMPQPPSGSLVIEPADVTSRLKELRSKISSVGGKVDRVFLSEREERERAEVSFRVFPEDFTETIEYLESLEVVLSKELREGSEVDNGEQQKPEEPNARIEVTLAEKPAGNTGLILGIAIPIILVVLAGLFSLVGYLAYRIGRRRSNLA